jgi:polar amino acid transport system substrate-binding protein
VNKKYLRMITLFLVLTMVVVAAAGCGQQEAKGPENEPAQNGEQSNNDQDVDGSLERVKNAGKITIGLDDAYPPMSFRDDDNKLIGYDIDLSSEIGKRLGVEVEWIPSDWSGVILALTSGKFDLLMSGLSMTEERAKQIDFSPAYIMQGQVVIVKEGENSINTKEDLKGKIVGTQLGSTGEEAAEKLEGLKELKKYSKYTEAFLDLSNDRIKAIVVDEVVGRHYLTKRPNEFKVQFSLVDEPVGIGFRKQDKALQEAVNNVLKEMTEDGTTAEISKRWFGEDISVCEEISFE